MMTYIVEMQIEMNFTPKQLTNQAALLRSRATVAFFQPQCYIGLFLILAQ